MGRKWEKAESAALLLWLLQLSMAFSSLVLLLIAVGGFHGLGLC